MKICARFGHTFSGYPVSQNHCNQESSGSEFGYPYQIQQSGYNPSQQREN